MKSNVKKEGEETKCDGGWEKADFIKQVDVGHFTALIQKAYKNTTDTHTRIHKVFSHHLKYSGWWAEGGGDMEDNEW